MGMDVDMNVNVSTWIGVDMDGGRRHMVERRRCMSAVSSQLVEEQPSRPLETRREENMDTNMNSA